MSKSPAFQWYAADYLADERVMQLSLESEAAYVRLLNYCWREGSIPAKPEQCAPMCKYADAKVIKPALALFMKSPDQPGRLIHKRLEEERAKQEAFRAKQSAHGKKGGRPKLDDEKPKKPNPLASLSQPLAEPNPTQSPRMPSSLSSTSSSKPTDVGSAGEQSGLSSSKGGQPLRDHGDTPLFDPANWPGLNDPQKFAAICTNLDFPQVDFERYRKQILVSLEGKELPATSLRNWIKSYLNNDKDKGELLLPVVQVPNDIPSNYTGTAPYVAPVGSRIPDMSSVINPNWKPPTA